MDFRKLESRLENLRKIETKVNNDKNILLIDIMKQNKLLTNFVNNALISRNMILSLQSKYQIKSPLIVKDSFWNKIHFFKKINNLLFKKRELWIYLTEDQKYATDSYSRYEDNILKNASRKNADFIAIGERAVKFCQAHHFNIIKSTSNKEKTPELAWKIMQIIKILFTEKNYDTVRFVINSNKNTNGYFVILPINEFNINQLAENQKVSQDFSIEKFKIYPNIEEFLDNHISAFIENSISSLLVESSFYKSKVGLISTNKIINELSEEIAKINKKVIRTKRELEIEEIVLLTKNNERFLKKGGYK
ncbi:Uncharacterised protein [Mycoplasmopsis californica]|uniref:F0F1 ATP synthase subunit gamma n=1 Tax=Mycoplasmopsis equigenitalium TaxID=114883 RepID=A0ABY5J1A6_9BACT|nr:F0F1 ATP synthase subunit gamma [Mycoplasmopsis equigenitalium]UUD37033.1 F0F1 ATP synthase subunit gamma [Mycoplasmopsis equigenitalium]VEU69667.1 Uncharacterised protein [Mycoplasmopsis californica]